jgi:hypothetical protein
VEQIAEEDESEDYWYTYDDHDSAITAHESMPSLSQVAIHAGTVMNNQGSTSVFAVPLQNRVRLRNLLIHECELLLTRLSLL